MSATDTSLRRAIDPYRIGRGRDWLSAGGIGVGHLDATGHGEGGPASKRVIVGFGFWIFLLSDIVMFSAFFAAHAVLQTATAGGPAGRDLFNWWSIVLQTACLLTSSFTCGLSAVATEARNQLWTQFALLDRRARAGVSDARGAGFCRDGDARCRTPAQRFPVLAVRRRRLARIARQCGALMAGHAGPELNPVGLRISTAHFRLTIESEHQGKRG
jgi:hypothetical protein